MNALSRWIPIAVLSGIALLPPLQAQEQAPARSETLCAPGGLTLPFASASPRSWNTWVSSTDLKEMFYRYLLGLRKDSQVIIIENEHPPNFVSGEGNVVVFTKNPHHGRYGFFPTP